MILRVVAVSVAISSMRLRPSNEAGRLYDRRFDHQAVEDRSTSLSSMLSTIDAAERLGAVIPYPAGRAERHLCTACSR